MIHHKATSQKSHAPHQLDCLKNDLRHNFLGNIVVTNIEANNFMGEISSCVKPYHEDPHRVAILELRKSVTFVTLLPGYGTCNQYLAYCRPDTHS